MRPEPERPKEINKVSDFIWEVPTTHKKGMLVPARMYASKALIDQMDNGVFDQVTNVACLPGIQNYAFCMPDGHWGYGFPIGGVAAFDPEENGIISPGGIGFDINCGMRLVTTNLTHKEVRPKLKELTDTLFKLVPAGVGCKGFVDVNESQFIEIIENGSKWCVENGYGWQEDTERTEGHGKIDWADHSKVSDKAMKRGMGQLGTLGSGNHYLETQLVKAEHIFDEEVAKAFGIHSPEQIVIMVHCGSRGFGHQIGTDYLRKFEPVMKEHGIEIRDRELTCAPFNSKEGQDYYKAMACAANMAFSNRQVILHRIREGFEKIFGKDAEKMEMHLTYDVAHNIAKLEEHEVNGKKKKLIVHRKGSTRAFPPGHPELAPVFKKTGQPVIIGGSMETGSWLLAGTEGAMDQTWGSTAHGSGRTMSRARAKREVRGDKLQKDMEKRGIYVRSVSMAGLAEEAGFAYKDVDEVIETVHRAGISKKVVKLVPISNVKG
jgi:tRNA-splicing ligase RtcB (3'-phosphate/5'-hydroxy nucleic acid ligase)